MRARVYHLSSVRCYIPGKSSRTHLRTYLYSKKPCAFFIQVTCEHAISDEWASITCAPGVNACTWVNEFGHNPHHLTSRCVLTVRIPTPRQTAEIPRAPSYPHATVEECQQLKQQTAPELPVEAPTNRNHRTHFYPLPRAKKHKKQNGICGICSAHTLAPVPDGT